MKISRFLAKMLFMKRHITHQLRSWKDQPIHKPLILEGARQVGKTFALETFGKTTFDEWLRIDFDKDKTAKDLFNQDLNTDRILEALRIRYEKKLEPGRSLLIFDEIQECPLALNSLKYFCEDKPNHHIVAAGSLLGIKVTHGTGFPVGKVEFLHLHPMSFLEFLLALNKTQLHDHLSSLSECSPIEPLLHQDLTNLFKIYCYIGGMPEAVKCYIDTKDYFAVRNIQNTINTAYVYDFSKHAPPEQIMKIMGIWHSLPQQLSKANKKFKFSLVHKHARLRDYHEALNWLLQAGLIHIAYDNPTPKLPLSGYFDTNAFKVYLIDVGLLGAINDLSPSVLLEGNALFTEYKGALTENVALQLLHSSGLKQGYYWTMENSAEVDLLLQVHQKIIPCEIKAGSSRHKQSLKRYVEKYHPPFACRGSERNLMQNAQIINIPLYLFERAMPLLERIDH